jgi:hypothetical protein
VYEHTSIVKVTSNHDTARSRNQYHNLEAIHHLRHKEKANAVGQISRDVELPSISKTAAMRHDL